MVSRKISYLFLIIVLSVSSAWARGGGGCLAEGTMVQTSHGSRPIERITPETEIQTEDSLQKPLDVVRLISEDWYEIYVKSSKLRLTGEHPLFTSKDQLIEARFLRPGDQILLANGLQESIKKIEHHFSPLAVYNLILPDAGVFTANQILTHNKGCFVPDTLIEMQDGSQKKISEIQVGDRVLSFDSEDRIVAAEVKKVYQLDAPSYLELELEDGSHVHVTEEHPFYLGHGKFQKVGSLKSGDKILVLTRLGLVSQKIRSIRKKNESIQVFNLMTEEPHTFFAAQIAVHNKGGGGGGGGGFGRGFRSSSYSRRTCRDAQGNIISCPQNPLDALPIFFYAVIIAWVLYKSCRDLYYNREGSDGELDVLYSLSDIELRSSVVERNLITLAQQDPRFSLDGCKAVAEMAFRTLQTVWQSKKYASMQELVFEDLAQEHIQQLRSMERNHETNQIINLKIHFIKLVDYEISSNRENCTFSALIEAEALDRYEDSRTGAFLRGDSSPHTFQEVWVFQWHKDRWLLREIEQTRETAVFLKPLPGPGFNAPAQIPSSSTQTIGLSALEKKVIALHSTDSNWELQNLQRISRTLAIDFLMAFEKRSMEPLNTKLTDSFYQTVMMDIEKLINDQDSWEFRNLCIRKVEMILVEQTGFQGARFASRITLHAQRRHIRKNLTLREDSDVTVFQLEAWFLLKGGKFLLDDMKVRETV